MKTGHQRRPLIVWAFIGLFVLVASVVALHIAQHPLADHWNGEETRDPKYYADVLKSWEKGWTSHFPPQIPPSADEVRFSAAPGFLQSSAYVQLHVRLSEAEMNRIEKESSAMAVAAQFTEISASGYVIPPPYWTSDEPKGVGKFPDVFTLYVLQARDRSTGKNWNHGDTRGVAVSRTTCEVVYWSESW